MTPSGETRAAAVMGAAIGALGDLGGGWPALVGQRRQQQKERETERERWRDELRRDTYRARIASLKQLSAAWWKFANRVRKDGSDEEERRVGFAEARDAWVRFSGPWRGPRTAMERG